MKRFLIASLLSLAVLSCGESPQQTLSKVDDAESALQSKQCSFSKRTVSVGYTKEQYELVLECRSDSQETIDALDQFIAASDKALNEGSLDENKKAEIRTKGQLAREIKAKLIARRSERDKNPIPPPSPELKIPAGATSFYRTEYQEMLNRIELLNNDLLLHSIALTVAQNGTVTLDTDRLARSWENTKSVEEWKQLLDKQIGATELYVELVGFYVTEIGSGEFYLQDPSGKNVSPAIWNDYATEEAKVKFSRNLISILKEARAKLK